MIYSDVVAVVAIFAAFVTGVAIDWWVARRRRRRIDRQRDRCATALDDARRRDR